VAAALRLAIKRLTQCGIEDARVSAELLLRLSRGAEPTSSMAAVLKTPLTIEEGKRLHQLIERRLNRSAVLRLLFLSSFLSSVSLSLS
jgi:methylase of polypeptide subunit release factors